MTKPRHVHGVARVTVVEDPRDIAKTDAPHGKPFLRVTFLDATTGAPEVTVDITTNLAELLGGVGSGLRQRHAAPADKGRLS